MLSKPLLWHLLTCLLLFGCGKTAYEMNRSETKTTSAPSNSDSTESTAGTDLGQPVVPPQPVIGSYLAAAFEIPAGIAKESCEVAVQESSGSFFTELNEEFFQLLPLLDVKQLLSIGLKCEPDNTLESFSASKLLRDEDRSLLASIMVEKADSSVKFIARFLLTSSSNMGNGVNNSLEFEVVPNVAPTTTGQSPSALPTGQNPAPAITPTPVGQASTPVATPDPTPAPDTIRPTITGIRTAANPNKTTEKYIYITGAKDDRKLAVRPYSFDGGLSWKSENHKSFPKGTRLEKNTLRVRDAAGNQTLHRIVILVE